MVIVLLWEVFFLHISWIWQYFQVRRGWSFNSRISSRQVGWTCYVFYHISMDPRDLKVQLEEHQMCKIQVWFSLDDPHSVSSILLMNAIILPLECLGLCAFLSHAFSYFPSPFEVLSKAVGQDCGLGWNWPS